MRYRNCLGDQLGKNILFFAFLFVAFPPFAFSENKTPTLLTFNEFSQKVLAYYPKLKQEDASVNLAIARKLQAASGFLPSLQVSAAVNHGDEPVYVFGALLRESRFTSANFELSQLNTPSPHTSYNAMVTGQLPIFDALQTISRVRSAKLQIDSAQDEEAFVKMEAFLVASEAYAKAVATEDLLKTVLEVSKASEEDVKQAEDLKEKGLILGADFYAAKVALGNINQLRNQLVQEKAAAHILMNILMGQDPFNSFELQGNTAAIKGEGRTLQVWFEDAYRFRPDLAALDKIIRSQEIEISREKSTLLPRIDAFGEARQDTANFSSDGGRNFLVGIKAKFELFDPAHSARVRAAQHTLKKLEYDKTILRDSVTQDLAAEFARYQAVRSNLPLFQSMLEDAKHAVDLTLPLYREGRKSIADLLAIRSAYLGTARGVYNLTADSQSSWTRLLFLSGQLDRENMNDVIKNIGE